MSPSFTNPKDKNDYIDKMLREVLINRFNPDAGHTREELVKILFPNWMDFENVKFGRELGLIARRISVSRHREFVRIRDELEVNDWHYDKVSKPEFLPYARPKLGQRYVWSYFNAIKKPWIDNVIKHLHYNADGLDNNAHTLEGVFGP
jgi:hypothetical protein